MVKKIVGIYVIVLVRLFMWYYRVNIRTNSCSINLREVLIMNEFWINRIHCYGEYFFKAMIDRADRLSRIVPSGRRVEVLLVGTDKRR